MKIEIKGKDQQQITSVLLQNVSDGVNKVTINTVDKWLGLHDNGPRYFEGDKNLYILSPYNDDGILEYDIQIGFIPENKEDEEILNSLIYTSEEKDQMSFILLQRNKALSVCKKENTKVLYKKIEEVK